MEPDDFGGWMEPAELVGGEMVVAHPRKDCIRVNGYCAVHEPSPHHMSEWPQHFRQDRGLMERVCPHGIGHPDPDDRAFVALMNGITLPGWDSVHGCDGCCQPTTRGNA